jgi:Cu-processing system ATP-binding protein
MGEMTGMIQLSALSKSFGPIEVLRSVDLTVRRGRVMAIVGPNGAGKTTLIKSILGLTHPDSGRITVDGVGIGRDDAYRAHIGYMPQISRFPDNLTARDLIAMLKDLRNVKASVDEDLIDRLGIRDQLGKPLRVLSGGTKQKVNAALAFLFSPELLILDEPTAGLDPLSSSILKDKILALRSAGKTFVVTSHVMSELETLADDVAFILQGRALFVGALDELKRVTRQLTLERAVAALMSPAFSEAAA